MNMNNPNKLQIKNVCSQSQIKSINTWINDFKMKKTIKPLYIYGTGGIGKTTLANMILEKHHYNIINLSSIYINNKNIIETINNVLINKSICMMFSDNILYKGLIIDDLEHYIDSDKNIFNNIQKILKNIKDYSNNPIIIISNKINKKIYNSLSKQCVIIKLKYTKNKIKEIIKKRLKLLNLYLNNTDLDKIIYNNNSNLTSIFEKIKFINPIETNCNNHIDYNISLKNNIVFNNIIENDMMEYIKKLFNISFDKDTISNILLEVNYDINILSLLILENSCKYVHNNSVKKYQNSLNTICKIYDNIILADNYEHFKITNTKINNNLNNYITLHGIIYPIYNIYINKNNKPQFIFKDTSIYSKSIIEIYNNKRQIYIESISNRFKNIMNFIKIYHHSKITKNIELIELCDYYINNDIVLKNDIVKYLKYNISKIYGYKIN